ncbi:MobH family relaxase [Gilliamella sp. ESL0250]|uniref:MobH family relaxase n=1 Tax=Gilliamella sp. ESL0250 TaxID=2705036 RepID=UPI00158024D5|nr:MobH family relaxase [Gilliamella sp. ESL0250]NUF49591.1 DNA-binding domain-containing protein [Gilliamella sp. ESL0250]
MFHLIKKLIVKNKQEDNETNDITTLSGLDGWYIPTSAKKLLDTPSRKKLVSLIWQRVSIDQQRFNKLYMDVINNYVEIVQLLPASEAHHHSYTGGMIDHGLEVANYALKLRQSYLLGANAEDIPRQAQAWSAAVVYGALLHDIGKVVVDVHVEMNDGKIWYPWKSNLDLPYRFNYKKNKDYSLHPSAAALMIKRILPDESITWLSQFPELFKSFLSLCSGHTEKAGVLSEIIQKADMFSVSNNLGGDPTKILSKPVSLMSKMIVSIRYLIESELILNAPKACDGWFDGKDVWVISKSFTDKMKANLLQNGITDIPTDNAKIFNILKEHGIAIANEDKTIWPCKIESEESGWIAEKLTLIRIPANVAFHNITNAPEPFKGSITPLLIEAENPEHTEKNDIMIPDNIPAIPAEEVEEEPKLNIISESVDDKASIMQDTIFNLFSNQQTNIEISEVDMADNHDDCDNSKENRQIKGNDSKNNNISISNECISNTLDNDDIYNHPFFKWVRSQIIDKKLPVNNQNACIHTVDHKIFMVTPKIFKKYSLHINGNDDDSNWKQYQREFQALKIHTKFSDEGFNIWKCIISGKRKSHTIKGYLIDNKPLFAIENNFPDNPHLTLIHDINIYKNN